MVKRVFDLTLSCVGVFFSLPLWALCIYAIWLEDGRPVFYVQQRVGKAGKIFKVVKFRTMGYKEANSSFAKFLRRSALDELPQVFNIFKGEMSFVGPRPLVPEELSAAVDLKERFAVRPGLTGVAQILAPKDAPILDKLHYDIWYVKNQSFVLDLALILKSFWISCSSKWDIVNKESR